MTNARPEPADTLPERLRGIAGLYPELQLTAADDALYEAADRIEANRKTIGALMTYRGQLIAERDALKQALREAPDNLQFDPGYRTWWNRTRRLCKESNEPPPNASGG